MTRRAGIFTVFVDSGSRLRSTPTLRPYALCRPVPNDRFDKSDPREHSPPTPTVGHFQAESGQSVASGRYQSHPYPATPVVGVNIKRKQFSIAHQIRVARRRRRGKPANLSCFHRYDGLRPLRITGRESYLSALSSGRSWSRYSFGSKPR